MAIEASRSAITFLRRHGLRPSPRVPMPRLATSSLGLDDRPLRRSQLDPNLMLDAEGDPPPDRGRVDLWPPPQEVPNEAQASEFSE